MLVMNDSLDIFTPVQDSFWGNFKCLIVVAAVFVFSHPQTVWMGYDCSLKVSQHTGFNHISCGHVDRLRVYQKFGMKGYWTRRLGRYLIDLDADQAALNLFLVYLDYQKFYLRDYRGSDSCLLT